MLAAIPMIGSMVGGGAAAGGTTAAAGSSGGMLSGMSAAAPAAGSAGATFGGNMASYFGGVEKTVDLLGSLFGTAGTTSTSNTHTEYERQLFSEDDLGKLRSLVDALTNRAQAGAYSKESAILDTQNLGDSAIRQLKEQALPQLFGNDISAGAYDSSATKQLANDLASRTADNIAQTRLQAILGYGQMESQQFADLANILQLLRGAFEKGHSDSETTSSSGGTGGLLGAGGL